MSSGKRALADVLWEAANERLSTLNQDDGETWEYSCCAVLAATEAAIEHCALDFLRSLGCRTSAHCPEMNDDQGTRYMWLLLAMHVAEDEGIQL